MLCYAMLCYAILCYTMLHYTTLHYTTMVRYNVHDEIVDLPGEGRLAQGLDPIFAIILMSITSITNINY